VFTSSSWWSTTNSQLREQGKHLVAVDDLIDLIWTLNERTPPSHKPIVVHDQQYAGETVTDKLHRTRTLLNNVGVSAVVLSALDEIAWLFNLRGSDIPYNPFFKSYAIVYADGTMNSTELFLDLKQFGSTNYVNDVTLQNYSMFYSRLETIAQSSMIKKIWTSSRVSQAIMSLIPDDKILRPILNSPVERIKARKNTVERQGMRNCQKRDAIARMKHLGWLEQQLDDGIQVNETRSAEQLLFYQQQQDLFQFPSFNTISASGDRAAIVHYSAQASTARPITTKQVYLLDVRTQKTCEYHRIH
jgi:Xaa-Pro aminopeptidase